MITGKDRGKTGKILKVFPPDYCVVERVNLKKRHQRSRRASAKGQVVERPAPIHVSNLMLVDPGTGKPTRVGFKVEGGKKIRIAKRSGKEV